MSDARDPDFYSPEDEQKDADLYAELNSYSLIMRDYAKQFADALDQTQNKPKEIQMLIMSLNKIATGDIQSMDAALNNFKKCIASIALKNDGGDMFGSSVTPEELPELALLYSQFIQETVSLASKAIELSNREE